MAAAITFHPISLTLIQRFVFDVLEEPRLASKRAAELTSDSTKQKMVLEGVYARFSGWAAAGPESPTDIRGGVSFAAAALAGFRQFYTLAWGSSFTAAAIHQPAIGPLIRGLDVLPGAPSILMGRQIPDIFQGDSGSPLAERHWASGVVLPEDFSALKEAIAALGQERSAATFGLFDAVDRRALWMSLDYAEARGLALMEAAGLVDPIKRVAYTDYDRLRLIERPHELSDARDGGLLKMPACLGATVPKT